MTLDDGCIPQLREKDRAGPCYSLVTEQPNIHKTNQAIFTTFTLWTILVFLAFPRVEELVSGHLYKKILPGCLIQVKPWTIQVTF